MDDSRETLWAPWRIEYVLQEKPEDCIFCAKPAPGTDDREELILVRGEYSFVIMNLYPYNNAHLMISPYQHTADIGDLDDTTHLEMIHFLQEWMEVIRETMNPEGFNTGANFGKVAGAGVDDHYHYHLVPRWSGDTNFMPILGHTKVLVEGLEETWEKLAAAYEDMYGNRHKTN
ncbi:MAG: HIT domain-containing protein [Candidatus Marinimicrobia bacterium]|nr:HIT domain-containing protein [Candidatus Neomarinimicrobiota bacterium]MCF7828682.1 HIT domain-containing protein [Candidatus Neomarinimicrobiota bacterium]MCF7880423.1 HIT domain-containing protein [Candidatus Neomarinimicrobiota bacterium]